MSLTKLLTGYDVSSEAAWNTLKLLKKHKENGMTLESALVDFPERCHAALKEVWPDLAPTRFNG